MNQFFDGRDVEDEGPTTDDVSGFGLNICRYCGTLQHPRYPFCCELASLAPAASAVPLMPIKACPTTSATFALEGSCNGVGRLVLCYA
jgi:hypothetical protein